jgi:hypothetical protein
MCAASLLGRMRGKTPVKGIRKLAGGEILKNAKQT